MKESLTFFVSSTATSGPQRPWKLVNTSHLPFPLQRFMSWGPKLEPHDLERGNFELSDEDPTKERLLECQSPESDVSEMDWPGKSKRKVADTISDLELQKLAQRPKTFVLRYVMHHLGQHLCILLFNATTAATGATASYAMSYTVQVMTEFNGGSIVPVVLAVILWMTMLGCYFMFPIISGWVATRTFPSIYMEMQYDMVRYVLDHPLCWFTGDKLGTICGRLNSVPEASYSLLGTVSSKLLVPLFSIVFSIVIMATASLEIACALAVLGGVMAGVTYWLSARNPSLHKRHAWMKEENAGHLYDVVENIELVHDYNAQEMELDRFDALQREEASTWTASLNHDTRIQVIYGSLTIGLLTIILSWSIFRWTTGHLELSKIILVFTLTWMVMIMSRDVAVALVELGQKLAILLEALPILLSPHGRTDAKTATGFVSAPNGRIELEDVTFAYPGGGKVIKNVTVEIHPGQHVGVIGDSGSGKSSLLNLIKCTFAPQSGRISIGGRDVQTLTTNAIRDVLAVVPQQVKLFQRTVGENIGYGIEGFELEDIHRAAEKAGCNDFVQQKTDEFEMKVGPKGVPFSGGQCQRIAVARAMFRVLVRLCPILLLDEATNALDGASEQHIVRALQEMKGQTIVAVAHRLDTLKEFDRVILMANGCIVHDGTPDEVLSEVNKRIRAKSLSENILTG